MTEPDYVQSGLADEVTAAVIGILQDEDRQIEQAQRTAAQRRPTKRRVR